jgi:DUF1365 family protein
MNSALCSGLVAHKRFGDKPHAFSNRVQLFLLDLAELNEVFRGRWFYSNGRANLVSFKRSDFLGDPGTPLEDAVRDRVEQQLGRRPLGSIRILTQLRTAGYSFNPVSFYYCYDGACELDAIVAEITNTPWRERHAYVLDAAGKTDLTFRFNKDFHVSPFFDMDHVYEWRFQIGDEQIGVSMTNFQAAQVVFRADLSLGLQPINGHNLAKALVRYPIQPLRMHLLIFWHAARLFLKRVRFFTHPEKRDPSSGTHQV